jgi:F0F1-type ATP synthase membrane subunit b/b'
MKIFEWVEEIERIYEELVDKAKKESLENIQKERKAQEKLLEETTRNNQKIIDNALKTVSTKVNEESVKFEELLTNLRNKIENFYYENKEDLTNSIFKELGFDF